MKMTLLQLWLFCTNLLPCIVCVTEILMKDQNQMNLNNFPYIDDADVITSNDSNDEKDYIGIYRTYFITIHKQ